MKKKYIYIQIIPLLLLFLSGCSDEHTSFPGQDGKYKANITLNVTQALTRTGETGSEVNRADILLFSGGTLEKIMQNVTTFTTTAEGYTSVQISFDTKGVRKAYVVGNIDDPSWLKSLKVGETTFEDMKEFETAQLTKMANPPFVMYGISEDIAFGEVENSTLCSLYRTVARIDVGNEAANFELQSARLLRSKVASTIFPGTKTSNSKLTDFDVIKSEGDSVILYSYENASTDLERATAVEITGLVNGVPLSQIIEFVSDDKPISLQRNYQYRINIHRVQANVVNATITVRPWKIGDDISNVVVGSKPLVEVDIDPSVGVYTEADSSIVIGVSGGRITFNVKANAECGVRVENIIGERLAVPNDTRSASSIEGQFLIDITPNKVPVERKANIIIFNKLNGASKTFCVTQSEGESQEDKFMVLVVAGQSNASGYDASGIGADDAVDPRVFQLSYGLRGAENLDVIPLTADADDIDDYVGGASRSLKGIHLPLAQELLKRLPADTRILVVPVSSTGTGFNPGHPFGSYDAVAMRPDVRLNSATHLRWGVESAYYRTLVDRVKYALQLNNSNQFLGFVWCQGERDRSAADEHYPAFIQMTQRLFSELNTAGLGARTNFGTFDKRSWYTFSSTSLFMNWYGDSDASVLFGGYKQWNPDGFIHVPFATPVNPGNMGGGASHFGQGSYRKVIAPAVAQCMDENGSLFASTTQSKHERFDPTVSLSEANRDGGSLTDADIQNDLHLYMPFTVSASDKVGNYRISNTGVDMVDASGLRNIGGAARSRLVGKFTRQSHLKITRGASTANQWSVSFMLKRTGGLDGTEQTILSNGDAVSPFVGFRYYGKSQRCAGITEFAVEPSYQSSPNWQKSVPGLLLNADRVRSLNQWIHYVVTYDNTTKLCVIYMNGQEVQRGQLTGLSASKFVDFNIGYKADNLRSFEGEFMEFFLWGRVISPETVKKLYLMGYYGFSK